MTDPITNEEETPVEATEMAEEKPKSVPPKPPIPRSWPVFPIGNQFRGSQGNNINNRQRPGRAANRGR